MAQRVRPADYRSPTVDGGIRLDPGQTFVAGEDYPLAAPLNAAISSFRNIRGSILVGSFDVANELLLLLLLHVHGPLAIASPTEASSEHEKNLRKCTFGVLIGKAEAAIVASFDDQNKTEIFRSLNAVKRVRDLMAHQPMWLNPINAACGSIPGGPRLRSVGFEAEIADDDYVWNVDEDQITAWMSDQQNLAVRLALARLSRAKSEAGGKAPDNTDGPVALFFDGQINHEKGRIRCVCHGSMPDLERVPGPSLQTNASGVVTIRAQEATRIL